MVLTQYLKLKRLQNVPPYAVEICAWLFIIGMALLGSTKVAGAFYILSLVLGLLLLWRLPRIRIIMPPAIRLYLGFYLGFIALVLAHIVLFSASTSHLDQVSRIGLGVLNGFIFLALFGFSREKLFDFVILMAGAHACVAIGVAIYQGIDFSELRFHGRRANGVTNAIPFSEMLMTSLGLVMIGVAGRINPARYHRGLVLLALMGGLGIFAVYLTGTRGTLVAASLLLPLLILALFRRVPTWLLVVFTVGMLFMALAAASQLAARGPVFSLFFDFLRGAPASSFPDDAVGARLQLWRYGLDMVADAPIFGHGIESLPALLQQPELGVNPRSQIYTFSHLHNQYLDIALKMGLVGVVLFFAPMAIIFIVGFRLAFRPCQRIAGLALLWAGGSYAIYGLTQVFYGHASTTLHYAVCAGMILWLAPGGRYGNICQRPATVA